MPAVEEFNNSYTDEQMEREYKSLHATQMDPAVKAKIKEQFLELLSKGANVTTALSQINGSDLFFGATTSRVGRKTIYAWRKWEEDFRRDWDEAYARGTDLIEQRVTDLALTGNPSLLQAALRYRNPARYAVTRQEVSGPDGGALKVERVEIVGVDAVSDGDDSSDQNT